MFSYPAVLRQGITVSGQVEEDDVTAMMSGMMPTMHVVEQKVEDENKARRARRRGPAAVSLDKTPGKVTCSIARVGRVLVQLGRVLAQLGRGSNSCAALP
jgi:hypothetical protein